MADHAFLAHDRYDTGIMRDEAADERDAASQTRDNVADRRDIDADARDENARRADEDFDGWLSGAHQKLLDRFSRVDDLTIDPGEWPDTTSAGLARMRAHAAEQRRLADIDRDAVRDLIGELRRKMQVFACARRAAARDRSAAARDRRNASDDRRSSARDRELSAKDRGQSVIEQELGDLPRNEETPRAPDSLVDRTAQAMARTERSLAASRALLPDRDGGTA